MPHAVPICYVLVDDHVYSVVDAKPKKNPLGLKRLRNVADNPRAAIVVDQYDDADWSRLCYVLLRGAAALVADSGEFDRVLGMLRRKYPQYESMQFTHAASPMIRIDVETVHYWTAGGSQ